MKLSTLTPVLLFSIGALSACGGGSKSPAPKDTTKPVITLKGDSALTHSAGTPYSDLGASASDNIDGTVTVTMAGAVDSNVVSSYTLTYSATDKAGNKSSVTRTVNVVDNIAPVITLAGSKELTHTAGTEYVDAGATAADGTDGAVEVTSTGSVDIGTIKRYTLTYTATDAAGNAATPVVRTVNVVDDVAPVIVINGLNPLIHNAGDDYADLGVIATDNLDEASAITVIPTSTVNSAALGSYTVTYNATDAAGNKSTAERTVTVADIVLPVISLVGAPTVNIAKMEDYEELNATVVDYDTSVEVVITGEILAAPDTYLISYNAKDKSGNVATTVTREVTVVADIEPDAFAFTPKTEVFLNTLVESDTITITGLNIATEVSIVDGEFSINGGDYTAVASTITSGQTIQVRATSGATANASKPASLKVGSLTREFDITTRTAEPSGLFEGDGTVSGAVYLADVKGIIYNEHFMLFDDAENVLYEGTILTYTDNDFTATVDVYKNGGNPITVTATGTIANKTSFNLTLAGVADDYGKGTISVNYNAKYEVGATQARFSPDVKTWVGMSNTVSEDYGTPIRGEVDNDEFTGGPLGVFRCEYVNGLRAFEDANVNVFTLAFNVESGTGSNCDHIGLNYKGFAAVVDSATSIRNGDGTDGEMWFAATNGTNSTFLVLTYR